jgi:hypothetical protein
MSKLDKNKYCIICLENTEGMRDEILSIAIDPYKYIKGENMLIVTFTTFMTPQEMKELFGNPGDRSYFLFEMNSDTAMVSVSDETLQDYLFEGLANPKNKIDIIDTMFGPMGINNFNNDIEKEELHQTGHFTKMVESIKAEIVGENKFSEDKLNSLSKEERDELVDELLEKGADLTENDKEVLNFLINKEN